MMPKIAWIGALCALGLMAAMVARGADLGDELLLMEGRFAIRGSEKKTIVHHPEPQYYRICVRMHAHDVPLLVEHDKRVDVVRPGDCIDVTAARIRVSAEKKLEPGAMLVGRFDRLQ